MSSTPARNRLVARADAVALIFFMLVGAAIAVITVVSACLRIAEVLPGRDVPVLAVFSGTPAEAPIGPGGAPRTVELDRAVIVAGELPPASIGALIVQQVVLAATVIVVVATLLWLSANIIRGTMFSRTNTALVMTAGLAGVFGFWFYPFFGNMGANGAFADISEGTFDNVVMSVELVPILLLAFVAALAGLVFTVGTRIQRETEGLV